MIIRQDSLLFAALAAAIHSALFGCALNEHASHMDTDRGLTRLETVTTAIEFPTVESENEVDVRSTPAPNVDFNDPPETWNLSLHEAVQLALQNSKVLGDLGGVILKSPESLTTVYDAAITETDPRFGVDAALSEFDAVFTARGQFEKNDRALNNLFEGGGTRLFRQDLNLYDFELAKSTAFGTELALRKSIDYDYNNAPGNNNPNLPWTAIFEGQVRQPLLQGAGVDYGRINGRSGAPGFYNGVLIARVNTDTSLAEFENGVARLISAVETAYWELYFAYRDLDAKLAARRRALSTWQEIRRRYEIQQRGGEAEKEAQARLQFFRLDAAVKTALVGEIKEPAIQSHLFRGDGGVYASERRLRARMGLPPTDGRVIRPSDEPEAARVVFDWDMVLAESLHRRPELRRQRWRVKRRQLELEGARNYLLPQLDAVAGYRFRGLGHDLIDSKRAGRPRFDNASMDLTSGDFQEWQLGIEYSLPIGRRRAHAAVRNAELNLARERAILHRQEQEVVHRLSDAYVEVHRAFELAQSNYNQRLAAFEQLSALEAVIVDADDRERTRLLDLILEAQRRLAEAQSNYYRSLAEHAVAVKNVHMRKGSLLDFCEIHLKEGRWPHRAYHDAARRQRLRSGPSPVGRHARRRPPVVQRDLMWIPGPDLRPQAHPSEPGNRKPGNGEPGNIEPGDKEPLTPPEPKRLPPAVDESEQAEPASRT